MENTSCPVAMFTRQETADTLYWPANSLAVDICGIAGNVRLTEKQMVYVRKRFKVIEPNGKPIPHPVKPVNELA